MKMFILLVWFMGYPHSPIQQPYAVLTTDCTKAFDAYAADRPWVLDANWRQNCTEIPSINEMEKTTEFVFNPKTALLP